MNCSCQALRPLPLRTRLCPGSWWVVARERVPTSSCKLTRAPAQPAFCGPEVETNVRIACMECGAGRSARAVCLLHHCMGQRSQQLLCIAAHQRSIAKHQRSQQLLCNAAQGDVRILNPAIIVGRPLDKLLEKGDERRGGKQGEQDFLAGGCGSCVRTNAGVPTRNSCLGTCL